MPRVLKFDLIAKRLSDQPAFPEDSTLFWSSRPYALDVVDEIEAGMALVGGDLRTGIYAIPDESLDAVMALESGSLRALLQTYDWPAEQIDAAKEEVLKANGLTDAYVRAVAFRGAGDEMGVASLGNPVRLAIAWAKVSWASSSATARSPVRCRS